MGLIGRLANTDYQALLQKLLPPGPIWDRERDDPFSLLLLALADEMARIDGRLHDALDEALPATAEECLPDWEELVGLPVPSGATTAARRAAIAGRLAARGGSSSAYFLTIASVMGYSASINRAVYSDSIARVGITRCGDRLYGIDGHSPHALDSWRAVWRFNVDSASADELVALVESIKPAHSVIEWNFT